MSSQKQSKSAAALSFFLGILTVSGLCIGFLVWNNSHKQPQTSTQTAELSKNSDGTESWKTFTSKNLGLSFKYPSEWLVTDYANDAANYNFITIDPISTHLPHETPDIMPQQNEAARLGLELLSTGTWIVNHSDTYGFLVVTNAPASSIPFIVGFQACVQYEVNPPDACKQTAEEITTNLKTQMVEDTFRVNPYPVGQKSGTQIEGEIKPEYIGAGQLIKIVLIPLDDYVFVAKINGLDNESIYNLILSSVKFSDK